MDHGHLVWSLLIAGQQTKKLEKPMALVGAGPVCDVVLTSPSAPWIAGLLVRTSAAVEFVPTHHQAAHLASCLLPGEIFDCLGVNLQVEFAPQPSEDRLWPVIEILSPTRYAKVLVNQPVATLGSGFPSAIRVPSQRLRACTLVLIPEPHKLLVYALPRRGKNRVQQLELAVGEYLKFEDIKIGLLGLHQSTRQLAIHDAQRLEPAWEVQTPESVSDAAEPPQVVFSSTRTESGVEIPSDQEVTGVGENLIRAQHSDQLALKIRDVFQGRESKRTRMRAKVWIITILILTLTTLYFAWQLFGNLRPFLW